MKSVIIFVLSYALALGGLDAESIYDFRDRMTQEGRQRRRVIVANPQHGRDQAGSIQNPDAAAAAASGSSARPSGSANNGDQPAADSRTSGGNSPGFSMEFFASRGIRVLPNGKHSLPAKAVDDLLIRFGDFNKQVKAVDLVLGEREPTRESVSNSLAELSRRFPLLKTAVAELTAQNTEDKVLTHITTNIGALEAALQETSSSRFDRIKESTENLKTGIKVVLKANGVTEAQFKKAVGDPIEDAASSIKSFVSDVWAWMKGFRPAAKPEAATATAAEASGTSD